MCPVSIPPHEKSREELPIRNVRRGEELERRDEDKER